MKRKWETYAVGEKDPFLCGATSHVSAFSSFACWYNPKTVVPVTNCETNETRYFSRTLDRSGHLARICEHKSHQGKIVNIY